MLLDGRANFQVILNMPALRRGIGIEVALWLCSPAKGHGRATAVIYARKASCGVGSGGSRVCGPILRLRKPQTAHHPLQECVG